VRSWWLWDRYCPGRGEGIRERGFRAAHFACTEVAAVIEWHWLIMVTKADNSRGQVFFVDDDPAVCVAVRETLEESNIPVQCFTHAAECLAQVRSGRCDLLIADLMMPEKDGMQLLQEVRELTPWVSVLVVTGYGDIPTAVKAIKCGAVDFIEKPLGKAHFVEKVKSILEKQSRMVPLDAVRALTPRELKVLKLIVEGKNNSEIAETIHRSVTVGNSGLRLQLLYTNRLPAVAGRGGMLGEWFEDICRFVSASFLLNRGQKGLRRYRLLTATSATRAARITSSAPIRSACCARTTSLAPDATSLCIRPTLFDLDPLSP